MAGEDKLLKKAEQAVENQNYGYAVEMFREYILRNPSDAENRMKLKGCEMKVWEEKGGGFVAKLTGMLKGLIPYITLNFGKDPQKVMAKCEKFLTYYPTNIKVLMKLGECLKKNGYIDSAVVEFEFLRQQAPNHIPGLRHLGELYAAKEEYPKAVICYEEILRLKPTDPEAARNVKDYAARGHIQESRLEDIDYRDQIRDKAKAAEIERAQRLIKDEQTIKSEIEKVQQEIKANPKNSAALQRLGELYEQRHQPELAIRAYRKSYEITNDFSIRERIGDMQLSFLESDARSKAEAAKADPDNEELQKAAKEANDKWLDFGVREYEFRLKKQPTNTNAQFRLGQFYFKAERTEEAIETLQKMVDDPRRKIEIRNMLGQCFARKSLFDMAVSQYTRALEEHDGMSSAEIVKELNYNLASAYEEMGEISKALEAFKKIFEVDIKYKDVSKKIEELTAQVEQRES